MKKEGKCRNMKNGRVKFLPFYIYGVEMVFLPLVFEVYKEVSAKCIKSFGFDSGLGIIEAIPILATLLLIYYRFG